MNIEDLVRSAQEHRAGQAPPGDRIRAALPSRIARRRRTRRGMGIAAGGLAMVAVAAAVVVPNLAFGPSTAKPEPLPVSPAAPTASSSAPTQDSTYQLAYAPTWVPAGLREHIRSAGSDNDGPAPVGRTLVRVWTPQALAGDPFTGPELTLTVVYHVADPTHFVYAGGKAFDIGGNQGYYDPPQGDQKSTLEWSVGHTVLSLATSHLTVSQGDLLRAARSVRPVAGTFAAPMRLNLPSANASINTTVSGTVAAWRCEILASVTGAPAASPSSPADQASADAAAKKGTTKNSGSLTVIIDGTTGPDVPPGGKTLTVGGRPARNPIRTDEGGKSLTYLVVNLGNGRFLTLVGDGLFANLQILSKIATEVQITGNGVSWLGS